jgi:hypothetical protein
MEQQDYTPLQGPSFHSATAMKMFFSTPSVPSFFQNKLVASHHAITESYTYKL